MSPKWDEKAVNLTRRTLPIKFITLQVDFSYFSCPREKHLQFCKAALYLILQGQGRERERKFSCCTWQWVESVVKSCNWDLFANTAAVRGLGVIVEDTFENGSPEDRLSYHLRIWDAILLLIFPYSNCVCSFSFRGLHYIFPSVVKTAVLLPI